MGDQNSLTFPLSLPSPTFPKTQRAKKEEKVVMVYTKGNWRQDRPGTIQSCPGSKCPSRQRVRVGFSFLLLFFIRKTKSLPFETLQRKCELLPYKPLWEVYSCFQTFMGSIKFFLLNPFNAMYLNKTDSTKSKEERQEEWRSIDKPQQQSAMRRRKEARKTGGTIPHARRQWNEEWWQGSAWPEVSDTVKTMPAERLRNLVRPRKSKISQ